MLRFFHRLLFFFDPETAHHLAVSFLKKLPIQKKTLHPAIKLNHLPSIKFASRLGLAAGFDKNAEVFPALSLFGFGFIEVGTVTPLPQEGNQSPRIWRTENETLVNKLGFNNCGLKAFRENLIRGRQKTEIPIFANIGKNKMTENKSALEDYRKGFETLKDLVDGFVVNISSPNTPGLRELQSQAFLESIASIAPKLPVFIKFSADLGNDSLKELLEFVRQSSFSGVVLVNTSSELAMKVAGKTEGGLSGRILFAKAVEKVSLAKEILKDEKIIIGVGGVHSADTYRKMRSAGADLVEIYTSFVYGGAKLVEEISTLAQST